MAQTTQANNPAFDTFEVPGLAGKKVEVRLAGQSDLGKISRLLNTEFFLSKLDFLLRDPKTLLRLEEAKKLDKPGEAREDPDKIPKSPGKKDGAEIYSNERMAYLYHLNEEIKPDDANIDAVDYVAINGWITEDLSIVAVAKEQTPSGQETERIVAHMCGRDLANVIHVEGYAEITAGLVHPDFRSKVAVQNMCRFAIMNQLAERYKNNPQTKIVSISKQPGVALALEASGFRDATEEEKALLRPVVLDPQEKWAARICTIRDWLDFRERETVHTQEGYQNAIKRYIDARKKRKEQEQAAAMVLKREVVVVAVPNS